MGGISQADFELAMRVSTMNMDEFSLICVKSEKNYRRSAKLEIRRREGLHFQNKLFETQGIKQESAEI